MVRYYTDISVWRIALTVTGFALKQPKIADCRRNNTVASVILINSYQTSQKLLTHVCCRFVTRTHRSAYNFAAWGNRTSPIRISEMDRDCTAYLHYWLTFVRSFLFVHLISSVCAIWSGAHAASITVQREASVLSRSYRLTATRMLAATLSSHGSSTVSIASPSVE